VVNFSRKLGIARTS